MSIWYRPCKTLRVNDNNGLINISYSGMMNIGITLLRVTSSSDFIINSQLGRSFNNFTRLHNSLNEL